MRTWLRALRRALHPSRPTRPTARRRLALEPLEDRCLLATGFLQTNLVADTAGIAAHTDSNLINPWGIAFGPATDFWIADNNAGVSTIYDSAGNPITFTVTIPPPGTSTASATPNGIVFNGNANEFLTGGAGTAAQFIFSTEDGTISAWSSGNSAVRKVDNSANGTVFKGLALANNGGNDFLYAADFNHAQVDVFDKTFASTGSFTDTALAAQGFAPFGIQNIGGNLFVTFAKQNAAKHDDVAGPGNGFIDVFSPAGVFIRRLASNGVLNSPWGLAMAPSGFGDFSGDLLVGNFRDGTINAFDPTTGASLGALKDLSGNTLQITDLWALSFGNGAMAGATNTLYFTAGGVGEMHGLFGSLQAGTIVPPTPTPTPMPPTPTLLDVSAVVSVMPVRLKHHHRRNPRQEQVTVQNNSGSTIQGPIFVILDGLPKKVSLRNATGTAQAHATPGDPFIQLTQSQLAAAQSVIVTLMFSNPKGKAIHFSTVVLAGSGTV